MSNIIPLEFSRAHLCREEKIEKVIKKIIILKARKYNIDLEIAEKDEELNLLLKGGLNQ
jgi:hypothetical protein